MTPESESFSSPLGLRWMRQSHDPFGKTEWAMLFVGSVVCALLGVAVAGLFGVPHEPGFNGVVFGGYAPLQSAVAVAAAIFACTIPAIVFGTVVGVEGGTFCLGVGVTAIAARCGGMRPVLQYTNDGRPLMVAAIETVLMTALAYGGWVAVASGLTFIRRVTGAEPITVDKTDSIPVPWNTIAVQAAVTAVCAIVLVQTDQPSQAIGGLSLAVIIGVLAAFLSSDVTSGRWYWFTPAAVGVVGYLYTWASAGRTPTGDVQGFLAALARPTPLDYAGVGLAAGVFGRWVARRWGQEDEPAEPELTTVEEPKILVKPHITIPPPPSTL